MQRTRFDFDVIAGPVPPRPPPKPKSPAGAGINDPISVERRGDDAKPGIHRQ